MDLDFENLDNLDDLDNLNYDNIIDSFNENKQDKETDESTKKCNSCGGTDFIEDYTLGILICNCGQVFGNILDNSPEWRNYDDNKKSDSGRCGKIVNTLLPQSSLGTSVNAYGRIKILHDWNSMPYKERSLNYVFKLLKNKCIEYKIPKKIENDSQIMYKLISECKHLEGKNKGRCIITRGINRESIIAATLFISCRKNGIGKSPKEIAKIFSLKETDLNKGVKNFLKLFKTKSYTNDMGTSNTTDFITEKCNKLFLKHEYIEITKEIATNIDKLNIASTHTSYSLAAATILLLGNIYNIKEINKKKLSSIFVVSDVTITKTYKKIYEFKDIITNSEKVNRILNNIDKYEKLNIISKKIYNRMKQFNIDTTEYILENEYKNNNKINILLNNLRNLKLNDNNFEYVFSELEKQLSMVNILDEKIKLFKNYLS